MKKHLLPFRKLTFIMTLICLFLHVVMSHDKILFESMENGHVDGKILAKRFNFGATIMYGRTYGGFYPYKPSKGFMRVVVW